MQALYRLGLDEAAAKLAEGYLKRQIAATEGCRMIKQSWWSISGISPGTLRL